MRQFGLRPSSFPSLVLDVENHLHLLFRTVDNELNGLTQHLTITEIGEIVSDTILDLGMGNEQMRNYISLDNGNLLGVGTAVDSTNTTSVVQISEVKIERVVSNINFHIPNAELLIFPNPSQYGEDIMITTENPLKANYQIYKLDGAFVMSGDFSTYETDTFLLNTSFLEVGMYVIYIVSDKGLGAIKFVIN